MAIYQAKWTHWPAIRWRALTWAEHKEFTTKYKTQSPMRVHNDIYRTCVLVGPEVDDKDLTAGIVDYIAYSCFNNSIFTNTFDIISAKLPETRKRVGDEFLFHMKSLIANIFKYSFEEIESWDEDVFLERIVAVEKVLGKPFEIGRIGDEPNKNQELAKKAKRPLTQAQQLIYDKVHKG